MIINISLPLASIREMAHSAELVADAAAQTFNGECSAQYIYVTLSFGSRGDYGDGVDNVSAATKMHTAVTDIIRYGSRNDDYCI